MCWNSTSLSGGQLDLLNTRFANLNSEHLLGELSRNFDYHLCACLISLPWLFRNFMHLEHFVHRDKLPIFIYFCKLRTV